MEASKFYIETFGCSMNISDSELIADQLIRKGLKISSLEQADVIVVNTCAVKEPTESKVISLLKKINTLNKIKIVAGCLPRINLDRIKEAIPTFDAVLSPSSYMKLGGVVDRIRKGEKGLIVFEESAIPLMRKFQVQQTVGIIPIAYGCLSRCAYCCVRFARGRLSSYHLNQILEYADKLVKRGVSEIWLTAQDTAAYGADINSDLSELLTKINLTDGDFKVRVGMMNPENAYKILPSLLSAYKGEKIYKFLHLPVQSGDEQVLNNMNRGYSIQNFEEIIGKFRINFPQITISTDIIVGFPGETEHQFEKSLKLIESIRPDIVNISRYGDRPKAPSTKLENKLKGSVIKSRSRLMTRLVEEVSLRNNSRWVGWVGEAKVIEEAPKGGYLARNFAYKPILIIKGDLKLGGKYTIQIKDCRPGYLIGDVA